MKFSITVLSFLALAPQASGFSIQQHGVMRPRTVLSMTTGENDVKETVKVGVIGAGRIGVVHLEAITKAPGVTPIMISNPTVSKAEAGKSH